MAKKKKSGKKKYKIDAIRYMTEKEAFDFLEAIGNEEPISVKKAAAILRLTPQRVRQCAVLYDLRPGERKIRGHRVDGTATWYFFKRDIKKFMGMSKCKGCPPVEKRLVPLDRNGIEIVKLAE